MDKQTIRIGEICSTYSISRTTLWKLRQEKEFPKPIVPPNGGQLFFVEEINQYFKSIRKDDVK
ncbi:hypothetical protein [Candidatus Sororendozoicomonas aggregata]|uniref:helix-turn-helix transcriptional regulator n=1 Tax=Candidatus Sororendozoicomonas aggregata TaxID=3073239 RepID=UPI002ED50748